MHIGIPRRVLGALIGLAVLAAIAVSAPSANATVCRTQGEAYVTIPGRAFSSLDQFRGGTQTFTYQIGTQQFRLGGNGIRPGSFIDFFAFDRNTGQQVGFIPFRPAQYATRNAGSNCVVNEEGPFFFTLPPGQYRIQANFFDGRAGDAFPRTAPVVNLDVQPAPPPPPDYPTYPTYPDPPCSGYFCGGDN